jgi:hypothetical protein
MQGIEALLGTEVWPWISHTVTIGMIAGGILTLGQIAFHKWRERPLIEYRISNVREGTRITEFAVTTTVFNRSPATMLYFAGMVIEEPKQGVLFKGRLKGDQASIACYVNRDIPPMAPGSPTFPCASARGAIAEWPSSGANVKIRVSILSKSKWITFNKRTISIKQSLGCGMKPGGADGVTHATVITRTSDGPGLVRL